MCANMLRSIKRSTIVSYFIIRDAFGRLFTLILLSTSMKWKRKKIKDRYWNSFFSCEICDLSLSLSMEAGPALYSLFLRDY